MFLVSKYSIQSYFDVFLLEHPWQRQFPMLVPRRYDVMPSDGVMILAPAWLWRHTFRVVFSCSFLSKEFICFVNTTWLCEQHSHIVWMVPCQVNSCFIIQYIRFNIKVVLNTDPRKNFVIQTPWNLSDIYKKVQSVVLANKIDSPREYFRVLYLLKWGTQVIYWSTISGLIYEVNSHTRCKPFLITCNYKSDYLNKRFYFRIMFHEIKTIFKLIKRCKRMMFAMTSAYKVRQNENFRTI